MLAQLALPATRQQEQARLSSLSATDALPAMEALRVRPMAPLADAPFAQLAYSKLLQVTVGAHLVLPATPHPEQEVMLTRLVLSALLAIMVVYQLDVLFVMLAPFVQLVQPHARPAQLGHIHLLALLNAPNVLPAILHRQEAGILSLSATFARLAMEAPRTFLDPPLADVPFAQLAFSKLLQATLFAQLVPTATPHPEQEVLLPRLVLSALLAILVV